MSLDPHTRVSWSQTPFWLKATSGPVSGRGCCSLVLGQPSVWPPCRPSKWNGHHPGPHGDGPRLSTPRAHCNSIQDPAVLVCWPVGKWWEEVELGEESLGELVVSQLVSLGYWCWLWLVWVALVG